MLHRCPAEFPDRVIHGDRFAAIADVEVNQHSPRGPVVQRNVDRLGRGARVVFIKTNSVRQTFAALAQMRDPTPFVLITHNSDLPITRSLAESAPPCVRRWYALNVACAEPRLRPLPMGMARPQARGCGARYEDVPTVWASLPPERPLIASGCWTAKNNIPERLTARAAFANREGIVLRHADLTPAAFLTLCGDSRFVISPPGNGIDCHRTWEAMYMGAIPLVKRSPALETFNDLPMVVVDDWRALTDPRLREIWQEYRAREWNLDRLFFQYWEAEIQREAAGL
jgi:hypothetical protein